VARVHVPPLRERKDDLPALVTCFAERMGRGGFAQSPALLEQLLRHDWPGNVRELRNVVERALSLGSAALADLGDPAAPRPATASGEPGASVDGGSSGRPPTSPPATAASGDVLDLPFKEAKAALVESFERDYLTALLTRHRGNISRAASEAGIDRNYVHRLVKKYGLEVDRG
jgi:DNA-binding NtrC family response regulator